MSIATQLVELSAGYIGDDADWRLVARGLGAVRENGGVYRFGDGSAISMTVNGYPVEYIGGAGEDSPGD